MGSPVAPSARHAPGAGDDVERAVRQRLAALLLSTTRLSIVESAFVVAVICCFAALPGHPPIAVGAFAGLLAGTSLATAAVAVPLGRLPARHRATAALFVAWGLIDIAAISAGVALTGAARSDLYLAYLVLIVFQGGNGFPRRTRVVFDALSVSAYAAVLAATGWHIGAGTVVLRLGMIVALAWGADMLSVRLVDELRHQVERSLESQRRVGLWRKVADLRGSLASLEPEAVWEWVIDAMIELGYDAASVGVVDDQGERYRIVRGTGLPPEFTGTDHDRTEGMASVVLASGTTTVVDYAAFPAANPSVAALGMRTVVGTPVRVGDTVAAVLVVGNLSLRRPSEEELAALELVAGYAAQGLDNARSFDAQRRDADRLRTILAAAPDAMVVYAPDLRIVRANLQAARLFGTQPEGLVGATVTDLCDQPTADRLRALTTELVQLDAAPTPAGARPAAAHPTAPSNPGPFPSALPSVPAIFALALPAAPVSVVALPSAPVSAVALPAAPLDPAPAAVPAGRAAVVDPEEIRARRPDGSTFAAEMSLSTVTSPEGHLVAATFRDISERLAFEQQLAHHATHDELTGLPNRSLFLARLTEALRQCGPGPSVAVCFLDIDHFKYVNDSRGHGVGDELVALVGERLLHSGGGELVARFGGDEFALLTTDVTGTDEALGWAWHWMGALDKPFLLDDVECHVSASAGVAFGAAGDSALDVMRRADAAMYSAKHRGRARVELFDDALTARAAWHLDVASALHDAVDRQELFLEYQPVVELATGTVTGVEALLRWQRPSGLVGPADFIPVAEDSGLIVPIGRWVLEEACRHAAACFDAAPPGEPLTLSVNVSCRQLDHDRFIDDVAAAIEVTGIDPGSLALEITESSFIDDLPAAVRRIDALRRLGVRVVIDDFGTGFSSLSSLSRLPIDGVKIDKSFVDGIGTRYDTVIRAVVDVAGTFGLQVVAEGVERRAQADQLQALGCRYGQGFLFSRPLAEAEAAEAVSRRRCPTSR